jgi:hypothetical protein
MSFRRRKLHRQVWQLPAGQSRGRKRNATLEGHRLLTCARMTSDGDQRRDDKDEPAKGLPAISRQRKGPWLVSHYLVAALCAARTTLRRRCAAHAGYSLQERSVYG